MWSQVWAQKIDFWNRERTKGRGALHSSRFWDGFDLWEEYEGYTGYPGRVLEPICEWINGQTTVLDVGAGSGGLSIPLARVARQVTAVDSSSAQCTRLQAKARNEGIANLRVLECAWEEVGIGEAGLHDVVTAGYCLFMKEIVPAIKKIFTFARSRVFLVHLAGHDFEGIMREVLGLKASFPDYTVLLNVLAEMGLAPSAEVFPRKYALPLKLQMDLFRYTQGLSEAQVSHLERHIQQDRRVSMRDGVPWIHREYRDALITFEGRGAL